MTINVLDMTEEQFDAFQANLTFEQLEALDDEEYGEIDPSIVREVVENEDFDDIEDTIYYKEKYNVPLGDEENEHLSWVDKVDGDLGPPLM